jgi:chromate reductase, NAD(P)H dehydrogenase (quinone)
MHILALTGSLRAHSINTELLRAAAALVSPGTRVHFSDALGQLPHFNPDLDAEGVTPPASVAQLRAEIAAADALLISCPEYAHGVAGAFKNLLDWLVSGPEMVHKPVCVLNASANSSYGPASLTETLRTMSAQVITGDYITVPVNGRRLDAASIVADPVLSASLSAALDHVAMTMSLRQT